MAELTISSDEIRGALERYVSSYTPEVSREEVGIVSDAGDGIAHVEGLPSTMANELLEFEDGTLGVALNLDVREIGVVILGDFAGIEEGQQVKRTGRVLSVPVGDAYMGRVVDALGNPIDDRGEIANEGFLGRSFDSSLTRLVELTAAKRDREVAYVTVARPLSDADEQALTAKLSDLYDRPVSLKVDVDPAVIGGVSVRVGSDLYDGTILRRLNEARQAFAK